MGIAKRKRIHSIQSNLIAFMIVLILSLTIITAYMNYLNMSKIIENYIDIYVIQTIQGVTGQVNATITEVKNLIARFVNSKDLKDYVLNDNKNNKKILNEIEIYIERNYLERCIFALYPNWDYITFVGIYFNEKSYYFGNVSAPKLHEVIRDQIESYIVSDNNTNRLKMNFARIRVNRNDVISIIQPISDFFTGDHLYWLVISINPHKFSELLYRGSLGETGSLHLIDDQYELIYPGSKTASDRWQDIRQSIISERGVKSLPLGIYKREFGNIQVVSSSTLFAGWYVVGYVSFNEITSKVFNWSIVFAFPLLIGLISSLFCIIIARKIVRPINYMVEAMHSAKGENYSTRIYDNSFKETQYICNQFNLMMESLAHMVNVVHAVELDRKNAEFASLQAQIRPHFIYNTLENINMMLTTRGEMDVANLVTMLGEMLRYNIDPKKNEVTLGEDILQVEKYLKIQKIRFGERLSYNINIKYETRDVWILRLLIQPIVENAVIHGIEGLPRGGNISINTFIDEQDLVIQIDDNGVGFPSDLNEDNILNITSSEKSGHLGIGNVNNRIKHHFGPMYGLKIIKKNRGTCVVIILPLRKVSNVV
jgi:two-component system sensor histidine kinase YesM